MAPVVGGVDVEEFEYLEFHDDKANSHKFYQLARKGQLVVYQWGRVDTKGQVQVKEYSGPGRASVALQEKLSEQLREGYERAPRPSSAPDVPSDLNNNSAPSDPSSQGYFLAWTVDGEHALDEQAIERTVAIVQAVLADVPGLGLTVNYTGPHGVTGGHATFLEDGNRKATFGFPPQDFLDSLTSRERKAVLELGTSRDGWLSANGKGSGVITTDKSHWDMAVRLFLSILASRYGTDVSCSASFAYGTIGLRVTEAEHSDFEWYRHWDSIRVAVAKHWFVEGDSSVIVVDSTSIGTSDTQYAW